MPILEARAGDRDAVIRISRMTGYPEVGGMGVRAPQRGLVLINAVVFTNSSGIMEKGALWEVRLEKGIRSR